MNQLVDKNSFGKVAVLLGGTSAERDISILSGNAIYQALLDNDVDVVKIDSKENLVQQLQQYNFDRAFIALHGRDGEDGVIQGFLKMLNIPFTGSDMESSALAMNKLHCKQIWRYLGFRTASFIDVRQTVDFNQESADKILKQLGNKLFVKPIREGSSVGMSKVTSSEQLVGAVKKAQKYDHVLVEQYIEGREYTVALLDGKALPSISMVTPNEFYDYEAKYNSSETEYFCPSGLTDTDEEKIRDIALKAFDAIGCTGWGRVDFIRDEESGQFQLLEVNTVPGMTESSLVPKAAKTVGIDFSELVISILKTSLVGNQNG